VTPAEAKRGIGKRPVLVRTKRGGLAANNAGRTSSRVRETSGPSGVTNGFEAILACRGRD